MKEEDKVGRVWLVGAGPGDRDLLTLKGARLLRRADAVVYDALAGMGILSCVAPEAEWIYAGKRAGNHAMSQEAINACLERLALEGKEVVRLKGGDPFLFGRGGEEMEYLLARGIPCEPVPGVTSALAVPAYNGIPVTHRDYSGSVHIITGHQKEGGSGSIDYEAIVKMGGTLVFLMGVGRLADICQGFLQAGMPGDTPAALLSRGTTPGQRRVVSDLGGLEAAADQAGLATPAIIVIGRVCLLAEELEWVERHSLFGLRVILTAPAGRNESLAGLLRDRGAEVVELPAIRLIRRERLGEGKWDKSHWDKYHWLVFTSPSGVDFFLQILEEEGFDLRRLHGVRLAVLGRGTAARLEQRGLYPDLVPEHAMQEELGDLLVQRLEPGERVLLLRGSQGRDVLPGILGKRKDIVVESLALYDTVEEARSRELYVQLREMDRREKGKSHETIWVFTSSMGVSAVAHALGGEACQGIRAACIGELTGQRASEFGMKAEVAELTSPASLADLIVEMAGK